MSRETPLGVGDVNREPLPRRLVLAPHLNSQFVLSFSLHLIMSLSLHKHSHFNTNTFFLLAITKLNNYFVCVVVLNVHALER